HLLKLLERRAALRLTDLAYRRAFGRALRRAEFIERCHCRAAIQRHCEWSNTLDYRQLGFLRLAVALTDFWWDLLLHGIGNLEIQMRVKIEDADKSASARHTAPAKAIH